MLRVVHAASEIAPFCTTGAVAEVAAALPAALARALPDGSRVVVLAPLQRCVEQVAARRGIALIDAGWSLRPLGEHGPEARVVLVQAPDQRHTVGFIRCPPLAEDPLRFAAFTRAVVEAAPALLGGAPDIAHAHDWHAGLLPLLIRQHASADVRRAWAGAKSVFTIHTLRDQGVFPKTWVERLGLRWDDFGIDGFEWHDQLSFLKAGVVFSDATAISPSRAAAITTEEHGQGLHGLFASMGSRLRGIPNGSDQARRAPRDTSWSGSATRYAALYAELLHERARTTRVQT